ncbi:MAG TPA: DUF4232 domain-containing protein [Streptosporangiaceae bacterium]|nr:DUF4232 domain-containing protein [Streptosporangiaceae bacterium]
MIRRTFPAAVLAASGLALAACGGGTPANRPTRTVTVTASPTPSATTAPAATAPAPQQTSHPATAAPSCLTRYLNGSIGLSQGTAGAVQVAIVFKNLNNVPCTLYGFPGVSLAAGTPVTDVGQPSSENLSTARELITLAPGGYANATLQIEDAVNFPASSCMPMATNWMAVIPPNQTVPLYIPYSTTACKGSTKLLSVTAVRPGNGG